MNSQDNEISSAKTIAAAATCAALYAICNILTSPIHTPWGIGEFRPGVIIPAFYAIIFGPIPAALGAGVGSVIGDLVSLVPGGASTPLVAIVAGGIGNFLGFLVLGYVYEKIKAWRGFILGTISGLFVGNLWAAAWVVFLVPHLPNVLILGLLLFWFATMFPFVIIIDPILVRALRPYARSMTSTANYPELVAPQKKLLWTWTIAVSVLVLAALAVFLISSSTLISTGVFGTGSTAINSARWVEILFVVSAVAVLVVGAFIPTPKEERQVPIVSSGS
jgi:uncharacterized membrane protein